MKNEFTYYAFISYSHKDAKWAEWIQRAIEHYKLPAVIRKEAQKPLPKRIAPVFRDATDLGVDVLVDGLHAELENSRYLIVVCSPNSAKPNAEGKSFVDEEVRHFCELGRAKQIIPVIIEGTPEESFGPVLKSKEILALDATKQPKARILNDIVAKILGLKPDALWRRAERERKKRLVIRSILCGLVGLCAAFAGWFAWDSNRLVKNYYANYVDSFGLPEGIFPLKESDLAHRHVHYRFEYKGFQRGKSPHADSADWCIWNMFGFRRRLVRVVQANSRGCPRKWDHAEYSDRPQIQDFKYDRDCRVREIRYGRYNGEGNEPHLERRIELWDEGDVTNGLIKFFANKGQLRFAYGAASATSLGTAGSMRSGKSEITQHLVQRDAKGRVTQRLFLNLSGGNVADWDGLYGYSYEYDGLGRQTAQWYLFRDGDGFSRRANKNGAAGRRYEYAGRNIRKVEYVDSDGHPGMVRVESFDEFDNNTESWYFDEKGNKFTCADGFAGFRTEYDAFGNRMRLVCLGTDGKPTLYKDGYADERSEYDARGNVTKTSYYGVDGKPTLRKDGYAEIRNEYDARGNVTKDSYFGVDGKPTLSKDGIAGVRIEYDVRGNHMRESYFGVDGKPTLGNYGVAELRGEHDVHGNQTRWSCFGVDGKPTLSKDGFAEVRMEYDVRGNGTRMSFFGVDGKPTVLKYGMAGWIMEYDERGNKTLMSYFGVDGKPTLREDGIAGWRAEYDARGRETRNVCIGVDGNPVLTKDGYAEMRREYDTRGNKTRESYYGVDGKPTSNKDGYAEVRFTRKPDGSVATAQFFDVAGNAITLRLVVVSAEVTPNLAAEKAGVKEGDVWCRLGEYDILKSEKAEYVREAWKAARITRDTEKELVVARKVGNAYEIHSFKFPVGTMGISVDVQNISDFDKLEQAYKAYCEKEKGSK